MGRKYLVINAGYHGCHTWRCPFGWAWRRVCHVYANDHGIRVEWRLISKDVIDASKLEVNLQSNVRIVLTCSLDGCLVESLRRTVTQNTYSVDAVINIPEFLDVLVGTRVIIGQDDQKQADTFVLTVQEMLFKSGLSPLVNRPTP